MWAADSGAFRDVQEKKWDSAYKDWFHISFDGNTGYNDGFWYEAWEGCYELVKLNLRNPAVKEHLFDAVRGWVRDYDIDGRVWTLPIAWIWISWQSCAAWPTASSRNLP